MDTPARTLFDKVWERHAILTHEDGTTLLHVGRHLVHEGSRAGFGFLRERGLRVRRPDRTYGTPDHYVPTGTREVAAIADERRRGMVRALDDNAREHGITYFALDDPRQGIVHVIGPEQGITLPGLVLVCGDSHTATHGALGALAFGIGASEVAHVLATQALWQVRPRTLNVRVDGELPPATHAKDLILALIARMGAAGATGHVIEYSGAAIRRLSVEARMTVCNMSIEAGARAGMISPDDTTYAYLEGRAHAPRGALWEQALADWRTLPTDAGARFDRELVFDAAGLQPMQTWGISPEHAVPVGAAVPAPEEADTPERAAAWRRALDYMDLRPGQPLAEVAVDQVFIGSCTNSRIEDLRVAAQVLGGRRVRVPTRIVPGSEQVRAQAESEGLDRVFRTAGAEWLHAGCSMCVGMNGDIVAPGMRCVSTSNRNFIGRQGPGARTHLASPATAAASALAGRFANARDYL